MARYFLAHAAFNLRSSELGLSSAGPLCRSLCVMEILQDRVSPAGCYAQARYYRPYQAPHKKTHDESDHDHLRPTLFRPSDPLSVQVYPLSRFFRRALLPS